MTMAPATRFTTPVIKRSLNPTYPAESSTFDYPIYLSLAAVIGGRGLEGVVWDKVGAVERWSGLGANTKDLMRKEYMGEFNVDVDQWFGGGPVQLWSENLPVRAAARYGADACQVQSFGLISSRRRRKVSGAVSLQIGFLPSAGSEAESLKKATTIYETILSRAFLNGEHMSVLGVPAVSRPCPAEYI